MSVKNEGEIPVQKEWTAKEVEGELRKRGVASFSCFLSSGAVHIATGDGVPKTSAFGSSLDEAVNNLLTKIDAAKAST